MPKIPCPCGNYIPFSEIPTPNGFILRSESNVEKIVEQVASLHDHPDKVQDFGRIKGSGCVGNKPEESCE
jgi:hypothetical protein